MYQGDYFLCDRLLWYGKRKIMKHVKNDNWQTSLLINFNIFSNKKSWKSGLNVKNAIDFTDKILLNNYLNITFFKNEIYSALFYFFTGKTKKLIELIDNYYYNNTAIIKKYGEETPKENILFYTSSILNGLTPKDLNMKIKKTEVIKIKKFNFNKTPKKKKFNRRKRFTDMLF